MCETVAGTTFSEVFIKISDFRACEKYCTGMNNVDSEIVNGTSSQFSTVCIVFYNLYNKNTHGSFHAKPINL